MHLHGMWSELETGELNYIPVNTRLSSNNLDKKLVIWSLQTLLDVGPNTAIWRTTCPECFAKSGVAEENNSVKLAKTTVKV